MNRFFLFIFSFFILSGFAQKIVVVDELDNTPIPGVAIFNDLKIKTAITETTTINKDANPNTLWELIKGTIRNETIKYTSKKAKLEKENEIRLISEINEIEKDIASNKDTDETEELVNSLKENSVSLEKEIQNFESSLRESEKLISDSLNYEKPEEVLEDEYIVEKILDKKRMNGVIKSFYFNII